MATLSLPLSFPPFSMHFFFPNSLISHHLGVLLDVPFPVNWDWGKSVPKVSEYWDFVLFLTAFSSPIWDFRLPRRSFPVLSLQLPSNAHQLLFHQTNNKTSTQMGQICQINGPNDCLCLRSVIGPLGIVDLWEHLRPKTFATEHKHLQPMDG